MWRGRVGSPEPCVRHRKPSHGSISGPDTPPSCSPLVPAPEGEQEEGRKGGGGEGGREERWCVRRGEERGKVEDEGSERMSQGTNRRK